MFAGWSTPTRDLRRREDLVSRGVMLGLPLAFLRTLDEPLQMSVVYHCHVSTVQSNSADQPCRGRNGVLKGTPEMVADKKLERRRDCKRWRGALTSLWASWGCMPHLGTLGCAQRRLRRGQLTVLLAPSSPQSCNHGRPGSCSYQSCMCLPAFCTPTAPFQATLTIGTAAATAAEHGSQDSCHRSYVGRPVAKFY